MSVRLDVVLPVSIAFAFGLATGLVVGHVVTKGGQVRPQPGQQATGSMTQGGSEAPAADNSGEPSAAQMSEMLAIHEKLLVDKPDDVGLLTTVGNYRAALRQVDAAAEAYDRAEKLAREGGSSPQELSQVLVGQAMILAEKRDAMAAIAKCEEAAAIDPADTRSRSLEVFLYMSQVMTNPTPGLDRKAVVGTVKARIDEILALDPANADALEYKSLIESVERMKVKPETGSPPPPSRP